MKLLPGKEKFETSTKNESWPQWNEYFIFHLRKETKSKFGKSKVVEEELGGSKFIVATLYAILEEKPLIATEKKENEKEKKNSKDKSESSKKDGKKKEGSSGASGSQESHKNKLLNQFFGKSSDKVADQSSPERKIFDKRRTLGATTIPLDSRNFTTKPPKAKHQSDISTGDMWRTLKPISSGIAGAEERVRKI